MGIRYHRGFQRTTCVDTETGELDEHRLEHSQGSVRLKTGLTLPTLSETRDYNNHRRSDCQLFRAGHVLFSYSCRNIGSNAVNRQLVKFACKLGTLTDV